MIFKYLVYRSVNIPGGNGELEAGFMSRSDAEAYCKAKGKDYYVKEV